MIYQNELSEVDPDVFIRIEKKAVQKGNRDYFKFFYFYINIVQREDVPYMLKKSTKLY